MPTMTLIEMVQHIFRGSRDDEVNSINDTPHSLDAAYIIRDTFYDMFTNDDLPEHHELFQLTGLADNTIPCIMALPSDINTLKWVKYDKRESASDTRLRFRIVPPVTPEDFLNRTDGRDNTDANYTTMSDSTRTGGHSIIIRTNENPSFWTTFDDENIIFDSYDSSIDSTLQQSKTLCYGVKEQTFTISDSFVPPIDENLFPLFLAASKVAVQTALQGQPNPLNVAAARSQQIRKQRRQHRLKQSNSGKRPNFGRT